MVMLASADTSYGPNATSLFFDSANPWDQLGVRPMDPSLAGGTAGWDAGVGPGLARSAGPGVADDVPLWSTHNPLFWFGVLLAGTLGLIAGSTSFGARVGPIRGRASVSVGKKA
jgi:hypothetical protein